MQDKMNEKKLHLISFHIVQPYCRSISSTLSYVLVKLKIYFLEKLNQLIDNQDFNHQVERKSL